MDAPPVLEFAEHVFNFVTLFLEYRIMGDWHLAVCPERNAGGNFALRKGVSKPIGITALVGQ